MSDGLPFAPVADGLRLRLRVTPKAARNHVGGLQIDADGGELLKVAVTAPADKGKANAAVIKLLAKAWGLAKSDLEITQGQTSRTKTLVIRGDVDQLRRSLTAWLETKNGKD